MPSSRGCRSSYDCIVKIKGVTTRPILFSQLMRSDGEGAMNPEELFADDRNPASEQERIHEDELHSLMHSILDWAISFLSESSQGTIRAIYFEGKTVKQHSEEEYVTVYAIYKRLARSYPVIKEIVLEELEELDDEIGVYLTRFHHYESKIAYYLRRILASPKSVRFPKADEVVEKVVSRLGITLAEEQLEAVRTSATSKVMVLTGGPGTGKTTILNAIIQVFAENKAKILLAAPTGRAAKRMSEAIGREARTIHRLLEYTPKDDGFARNEDNPLACGLLVVDEASMMDTMLAYHLLKAAPLGATIVFVGDVHQLPSVGPGNVLGDLIASGAMPVVELVEVFRQAAESEIVCNAHLINRGELPRLESSKDRLSDFYFMRQDDPDRAADIIVDLVKNHIPRRFQLDPFDEIQVLSPMHKGTVGAANLNLRLQQALNPEGEALQRGERLYRLGDKVMQIRNNYEKDVYNGDIGRVSSVDVQEKCLVVRYDDRYVGYDWEELDEIVAAYAISIHKSQGSEYPAVVIPLMTQHYMLLQRNLIYTGVTRGKRLVVLVGEPRALAMAVKNNRMQKRYTWLARRLGAAPEAAGPQTEGERT